MIAKDYLTRRGKSRHIEVLIECEHCGAEKWVRLIRMKKGQGRFCSLECANLAQQKWGRENVYFFFDMLKDRYIARWRDEDTGDTRVSHKSKFIWESAHGEIPDGYDIHHIDGDKKNDNINNLEMVEGHLHRQGIHGANRKVISGIVHKQCYRCKDYYTEAEFTQSYCTSCHAEYMREYRSKLK